jgi:pimeloyl-ACP methyl ester carboxylesterase
MRTRIMNIRTFVSSAFLTLMQLFAAMLFVEPAFAQLGMTVPVDPPDEPCTLQRNQISPPTILPTGLLPNVYRWAPGAFLENDPNNGGFTKPDEQNGRLQYFLRDMAGLAASPVTATNQAVLVDAVLLYLRKIQSTIGSIPAIKADPGDVATAVAQIAVTGRRALANFSSWHPPLSAFSGPQDADLIQLVQKTNPTINQTDLQNAVKFVLDASYSALWAVRSNDPTWRAKRAQMGWIAVSGEDDTPHRPVNVPTAPFPQYDLPVTVNGIPAVTRYMVASAGTFIGPGTPPPGALLDAPAVLNTRTNTGTKTGTIGRVSGIVAGTGLSGQNRTGINLGATQIAAGRSLPVDDLPTIPPGSKIIIYVHGGGSRLEEAVPLASWLITYGRAEPANQAYTVISFDMPNSAYGDAFDPAKVYGSTYHPSMFHILNFEEQYVINFIEALDQKVGNVKNRVAAVIGGSLGGNMSLLLARESKLVHPYLKTIVAWSPTSMLPGHGNLGNGLIFSEATGNPVVNPLFGGNDTAALWGPEEPNTRGAYFHTVYFEMISPLANIPPDPKMWFRDGWYNQDRSVDCKASVIAQSRFDRYEVYSSKLRRWTTAIDTEQAMYSFQDEDGPGYGPRYQSISSRLLLVAGEKDCYRNGCIGSSDPRSALLADTLDIYGYTHDVASQMRGAPGRTLFINNTGHSIHDERPKFFAGDIVSFLTEPDTNVKLTVSVGDTGLRWNSKIVAFFWLSNGGGSVFDLNAWWHPWPAFALSPNNPCGACGLLHHFELRPGTTYDFTAGLSRIGFRLSDIQTLGIAFQNGTRGGANVLDMPDSFSLDGVVVSALSGPSGTGQMAGASGQPLQILTTSNATWQTSQITQPTKPTPGLSVAIVSQGLSAPGGNSWIVVTSSDPSGNPVSGTVRINGSTGSTSQQISFLNTCTHEQVRVTKGAAGGAAIHSHTSYEAPSTEVSVTVPAQCTGSVSVPGFADGLFTAGWLTSKSSQPSQGGPNAGSKTVSMATMPVGGMITRPLLATLGQMPALSASACATVNGKSCLAAGQTRPRSASVMSIVVVANGGSPVAGASISVPGQNSQALTNASGVAVINYNPCVSSSLGPQGVPIAMPAPCQASATKSGYQPFSFTLP